MVNTVSKRKYITNILFLILISSCSNYKNVPNMNVTLTDNFANNNAYSKINPPKKLEHTWWENANDKILNNIIHQIKNQNLSLEQAQLRLLSAREQTNKADFFPVVNASSDIQYNHTISGNNVSNNFNTTTGGKNSSYYNAKIDASWEIPLYGQYDISNNLINANIIFAQADIEAIYLCIIAEAVKTYSNMRRLQQEEIALGEIINAQKKIFKYYLIKYKAGLITEIELNSARNLLFSLQNEILEVVAHLKATTQQLAKLVGKVSPEKTWLAPADVPIFNLPSFTDTPADVLRNRPDIHKEESLVLAAASELKLARSEMYPKLSLTGSILAQDNIIGSPLIGQSVQFIGIPTVSLPLFDWGRRTANIKGKNAKLSEAASRYRETVIQAINEVEEFWSYYNASQNKKENTAQVLQLASATKEKERLLFNHGIIDGIKFQDSLIKYSRAKIISLQAISDNVDCLCALVKALGGGIPKNEKN